MIKLFKKLLVRLLALKAKKVSVKKPKERKVLFIKPKRIVKKVFLHCSASDIKSHDDISVIRDWHLKRGFSDIGYQYFIKKNGEIQIGRSLEKIPAAQKGHNKYSIAICVSGLKDFTDISLKRLKLLCQIINKNYDDLTFHGHKEVSNKTCPVFNYKKLLNLSEHKLGQIID